MLADQRLELCHHLGMAAERELRLDQLLERRSPQLSQPRDLALGERLVREVRQRRAPPQRERPLERRSGALGAAGASSLRPSATSRSNRCESRRSGSSLSS